MDVEQLKQDAAAGKLGVDQLLGVIVAQEEEIRRLQAQLASRNPTKRLDKPYSAKAEEGRKQTGKKKRKRKRPLRRGRLSTADKIKLAERREEVYPLGVDRHACKLSHTRVAWRLEDGRAVLVAYDVFRYGNLFGKPPGLVGRGEYGIEILVALAYQVYCVGLSLDKACQVLSFFQQLKLTKSQADSLLNQLSRCWESEFETLCRLLANAAVVHCDETSWSINSVWAFLNDKLTVLFYGVHKDGETLKAIIDKDLFAGVLVSDDAAVYQGFSKSQKCWAHLLRKAIKLTLQAPDNLTYRKFADRLLEIYGKAKRIASDRRFRPAGRQAKVGELDDEILELCLPRWIDESVADDDVENDYRRLCSEVMRLMLNQELFVFVTVDGVAGNNNSSERQLRGDAIARKTGRTNKTPAGAKRQSIISSVLQSIGKQLGALTLNGIIAEVHTWMDVGSSSFKRWAQRSGLSPPSDETSLLDHVVLKADA
jgi:hypothetical protein